MFDINRKNLLTLLFFFIASPLVLQATDFEEIHQNLQHTIDYSEKNPTSISLAQLGFNNPFLCSAFLSSVGFGILHSLSKQSYSPLCETNVIVTLLGWAFIHRFTHNYLINTNTPHKKTSFCTNRCTIITSNHQPHINQDEQLCHDSCKTHTVLE